ncbi:MAG: RHS repeat-associated core domain-containing protein [candidate division Zixibacteria bacterium]|nr:RHS repeat-associated core domain-containing protein [candidate division Zixibacteria bacterium]
MARRAGNERGAAVTSGYDAWNRRIKKSYGGATFYFIPALDGQQLAEYYSSGGWQADYVYLNGVPIARLGNSSQGGREYYLTDHLGTPHVLADSAKTVRWKSRSYPFGVIYNEVTSTSNYVRFPGQWKDSETRLTYNWHRYYNPRIGRYYQADPLGVHGDETNMYAYALNSPLRYIDPTGLSSWRPGIVIALNGLSDQFSSFWGSEVTPVIQPWLDGEYFGTNYGEFAVDYWASKYNQKSDKCEDDQFRPLYGTMGGFAALWTKDTWKETASTLGGGYLTRVIGPFPPRDLHRMSVE